MPDSSLVCCDCGATFLFTEAEQEFFRSQGFTSPPRRCKGCRARNRRRRPQSPQNGNPRRPSAGPVPDGAMTGHASFAPTEGPGAALTAPPAERPPRRPREGPMHATVCSLCGASTEVPFVPDGVRPVFCLPCLKKQTR